MNIKEVLNGTAFDFVKHKDLKTKEQLLAAMQKHYSVLAVKAEALGYDDLAHAYDEYKAWITRLLKDYDTKEYPEFLEAQAIIESYSDRFGERLFSDEMLDEI